jgi:hypothetical protein
MVCELMEGRECPRTGTRTRAHYTKRYYTEVRRGAPIDSGILSILHAVAYVRTCGFVEIYSEVLDA